jgi:excisionase family DNA binding protein
LLDGRPRRLKGYGNLAGKRHEQHLQERERFGTANGAGLLTAEDVAHMTGMGVDWIYAQARLGRIPTVRLGRYRRFRLEAIEQWVRDLETDARLH